MLPNDERCLAAIDCGTNSTRLLIAHPTGEQILRETRITRLGASVDRTGRLSDAGIERTLAVLCDYRSKMDLWKVCDARLVATSAVRDADNGMSFLRLASGITGIEAELLSGNQEGHLAFEGATWQLAPTMADELVVDIGGGSTELVVRRNERIHVVSLDIGSVRLTERCFGSDPPLPEEISEATATVGRQLVRARSELPLLAELSPDTRMIGLAGTVASLAVLILGLPHYRSEWVHHAALRFDKVDAICGVLLGESASQRSERPGVPRGRADVIAAGALILREVMKQMRCGECLASESDVLDGLILSLEPSLGKVE